MKKYLILVLAIIPSILLGQVTSVEIGIIPENPTQCDIIYVTTITQFATVPVLLDFDVHYPYHSTDSIALSRCYRNSVLTEAPNVRDTFMLGSLYTGTYHVSYTANSVLNPDSCGSPLSTRSISITFYVSDTCRNLISGIENIADNGLIKVFPNPVSTQVQFSENANAQLYSITGQLVAEKQNVSMLDMSALASGIYTLVLTDRRGVVQRSKVVKE